MSDYLPVDQCIPGHLYRIHSRNLTLGVFDGHGGFIGVREKFGSRYLFTEYHCDLKATVRPHEDLGAIPEGMVLKEELGSEANGRRVEFKGSKATGGQGWVYEDEASPRT